MTRERGNSRTTSSGVPTTRRAPPMDWMWNESFKMVTGSFFHFHSWSFDFHWFIFHQFISKYKKKSWLPFCNASILFCNFQLVRRLCRRGCLPLRPTTPGQAHPTTLTSGRTTHNRDRSVPTLILICSDHSSEPVTFPLQQPPKTSFFQENPFRFLLLPQRLFFAKPVFSQNYSIIPYFWRPLKNL